MRLDIRLLPLASMHSSLLRISFKTVSSGVTVWPSNSKVFTIMMLQERNLLSKKGPLTTQLSLLGSARSYPKAELPCLLRAPSLCEFRWSQVSEKPSFYLRFVGSAYKPDDDTLYPRRTIRCRARAIQNFTNTCANRVQIWFRVLRRHRRFSRSFCSHKTGPFQKVGIFSDGFDDRLDCRQPSVVPGLRLACLVAQEPSPTAGAA